RGVRQACGPPPTAPRPGAAARTQASAPEPRSSPETIASGHTCPASLRVHNQSCQPFAMERRVAEHRLRRLGAPVIEVEIVFPRETHAAVNLNAAVADRAARVAGVELRNRHGG